MPQTTRRTLLTGAATSLALLTPIGSALAQGRGLFNDGIDGDLPYDDERLYRDEMGRLYRRRACQYVPFPSGAARGPDRMGGQRGRGGGPAIRMRISTPPRQCRRPRPSRRARQARGQRTHRPRPRLCGHHRRALPGLCLQLAQGEPVLPAQEVAYTGSSPRARSWSIPAPTTSSWCSRTGARGATASASASRDSLVRALDGELEADVAGLVPPKEMIARTPKLARSVSKLQSGSASPRFEQSPRRPRPLPLAGQGDTLYRIHGTLSLNRSAGASRPAASA